MGLAQKKPTLYSPEEYLRLERSSNVRHEYIDGEIFEMAGGNRRHNGIETNCIRLISTHLLDRDCSVYGSDMRIKIESTGKYSYADAVALCGKEIFEDENEDTLINPSLIIEVLSKSTEAYDRGQKFEYYQTIPSFREYVLIAQEPYRVELYVRKESNIWTYFEYRQPDDLLVLDSIDCKLALKDIYHRIPQKFPKEINN